MSGMARAGVGCNLDSDYQPALLQEAGKRGHGNGNHSVSRVKADAGLS